MTFIQLTFSFGTVSLGDTWHVAHVHRITRAKICPNRSELRSPTGCSPTASERDFRSASQCQFPSLSLSLSIYLVLHPVDISNGNFFPSRKKRAAVYLKRQGFIVHSRGNDTLSNNHLALVYLGAHQSTSLLRR